MADGVKIKITGDSREFYDELKGVGKKSQSLFKSMFGSQLLTQGITAAIGGIRQLGSEAVNMGKQVVSSFADYEQLTGGIETLFKGSADKVMSYAKQAYKTAGVSANSYMESVTSFSASLINSLGGDTEKAAEKANQAMLDMSDNANKMGSDMSSIQNAYQGFAKQNYTMLDNLKLGYGGTKTEMQRLLADATKLSGIKYDIDSYADIVDAIHVIQTEMGITGTTALEAEKTISGSINSLKASFQDLLTGIGSNDADLDGLFNNVYKSLDNVINNLEPVIKRVVGKVPQIIGSLKNTLLPRLQTVAKDIFNGLSKKLPDLLKGFMSKLPDALKGISSAIPSIAEGLFSLASDAVEELIAGLPQLVPRLIEGIANIGKSAIQGAFELVKGAFKGLLRTMGADFDAAWRAANPMGNIDEDMAASIKATIDGSAEVGEGLRQSIIDAWSEIDGLLSGTTGTTEAGEAALLNSASSESSSYITKYLLQTFDVDSSKVDEIVAKIDAAQAAIDGAVSNLGLNTEQETRLQELIDNNATATQIQKYLESCGVDETTATEAAQSITKSTRSIDNALNKLGISDEQKTMLAAKQVGAQKRIRELALAMGVDPSVLDEVLSTYDTFNDTVGGKVTGAVTALTQTISDKLTDGEADTKDEIEALKAQVRETYGAAVEAVNTVTAEEIAKLDVNSATYDTDVQNIKDKGAEAIAELESQESAYISFIDANAGRSTEIVEGNLKDLKAIEQQAVDTANKINELSSEYQVGRRDYLLVKSGADKSEATIGGALTYAKGIYNDAMAKAQADFDTKIEQLKSDWESGKINDANYEIMLGKYTKALDEQKAAAQTVLDTTLAEIFKALQPEQVTQETSVYDEMLKYINEHTGENGITDLHGTTDYDMKMRGLLDQYDIIPKEFTEYDSDYLTGKIGDLYDALGNMVSENGLDITAFATAFDAALDAGVLEGSAMFRDGMDYSEVISAIETTLGNAIGNVDVSGDIDNTGEQVVSGFETAIDNRTGRIGTAARNLAGTFVREFNAALDIHSPSRKMEWSGIQTGKGFEIGAVDSMETAIAHVQRLVGKFNIAPQMDFSGITGSLNGAVNTIAETEAKRDVVLVVNGRELARTQVTNNQKALAAHERALALGVGAI